MAIILWAAILCGCVTKVGVIGYDTNGRPVPLPIFSTPADIIGELTLTTSAQGDSVVKIEAPPPQLYPVRRVAVLDKKGRQILGYNEYPIYPGLYHSHVHITFFAGLSQGIRAVSNLVGTLGASVVGYGAARGGVVETSGGTSVIRP